MAEHTPGPWTISESGLVIHQAGNPLRTVGIFPVTHGERYEEELANARLIAAAPDLLRACELALTILEDVPFASGTGHLLQTAIAKAKGEDTHDTHNH